MTSHMIDKKTNYSLQKIEGSSSASDVGSNDGTSMCFDTNTMNKRKHQKSPKNYLNKSKNEQNSNNARKTTIAKSVNKGSSAAYRMAAPRIFFCEVDKKHNGVPKDKQRRKNSYTVSTKRKNTDNDVTDTLFNQSNESVASVFSSESSGIEVNPKKNLQSKSRSLINLDNIECGDSYSSPSPLTGSLLSLKFSRPLEFEHASFSSQKRHFDYLKEFDIIRNVGLFNHFTRSMRLSENAKKIFSLVPKLSPSSEPLTLKRRPYSCGVLSINNSQRFSHEAGKYENKRDLTETTMKINFENSDSSAESDNCVFLDDKLFTSRSKKDKDTILIVRKPIRVKYIDEATKQIKELILYSDDFLTNMIKEKGSFASKKKIFECLLKQSTDYKGASVRVITDAKKFFNNIYNYRKSQGDVKPSSAFQMHNPAPPKISKKATREHTQNNLNVPRCTKSYDVLKERASQRKPPIKQNVPLGKDSWTDEAQPERNSNLEAENLKLLKNKKSRILQNKTSDNKFDPENGRHSRIALKRINVEEIIASNFSNFFHFYAKLGGRLKSGAAISKKNSSLWLKRCGIIADKHSENMADNYFLSMASTKSILNIGDYMQYLVKIARDKRMLLVDVIQQLMSVEPYCAKKHIAKRKTNRSTFEAEPLKRLNHR